MAGQRLRSGDILVRIGEGTDQEIILKRTEPLDMSKAQLLPDIRHVLSRYFTIAQEIPTRQLPAAVQGQRHQAVAGI